MSAADGIRIEMDRLDIPEAERVLFCVPEADQLLELARTNRAAAARWKFHVAGEPVEAFRRRVRRHIQDAARKYTKWLEVGAQVPEIDDSAGSASLVLMAGHQPEFYHPGIWVKNLLLDELCRSEPVHGINLNVDSDELDGITMEVPFFHNGRLDRQTEVLLENPGPMPYEECPAPGPAEIGVFFDAVTRLLASLPESYAINNFNRFRQVVRVMPPYLVRLGDAMIHARRAFEGAEQTYLEAPVSRLSRTEEFLLFALEILERLEEFFGHYNGRLAEYRSRHKLRYSANPLPDLHAQDGKLESPFWFLDETGLRRPLWVHRRGDGNTLALGTDQRIWLTLSGSRDEKRRQFMVSGMRIRPRALILTMFTRLFACDLFLHGIGGARYDTITDGIIEGFYGVKAPAYAAVSLTWLLPVGEVDFKDDELALVKRQLRDVEYNPQRFVEEAGCTDCAGCNLLVADKKVLIERIREAQGAEKKALAARMKEIDQELRTMLAPCEERWKSRLLDLENRQAQALVTRFREYPFCFYDSADLAALARSAL